MARKTDTARKTDILVEIKKILVNDLDLDFAITDIADDAALLEDGLGLDSVVLVELITHLEQRFDIQFDDQHLRAENFASLSTLGELVAAERAALAPSA